MMKQKIKYDYHLLRIDYPDRLPRYEDNIRIICNKHGEFNAIYGHHKTGLYKCPDCQPWINSTEKFIEASVKKFGVNKFDYSETNYKGNDKSISLICPLHGKFTILAGNHLSKVSKGGCRKCIIRTKYNVDEFISKAKKIHGNKYNYNKFDYLNVTTKGIITCSNHGIFLQAPYNHINLKQGCPKCSNNIRLTTKEFIKRSIKIHGYKYDYSRVTYSKNSVNVKIICKIHGEFLQRPSIHMNGGNCGKCSQSVKSNVDEFISKAKKIHGNIYQYNKVVYKNNRTNVIISCKIHGDFKQTPTSHINHESGCIKCGNKRTGEYQKNKNK